MDKDTNIAQLKKIIGDYCEARDWDQYHSAKELAIGAVTEASELLEPFRFLTNDQVEALMENPEKRKNVCDEISDILFFILRLAQKYDIDVATSFFDKMERNSKRYSVEEFKGKNHKA